MREGSGNTLDYYGDNDLTLAGTVNSGDDLEVPALEYNPLASTNLTPSLHLGDIGNYDASAAGRS